MTKYRIVKNGLDQFFVEEFKMVKCWHENRLGPSLEEIWVTVREVPDKPTAYIVLKKLLECGDSEKLKNTIEVVYEG